MKAVLKKIEEIEESFMAIAYAEAARFEDIWNVLKMEDKMTLAREKVDFTHPEECQYDDNELCYYESSQKSQDKVKNYAC